MDNTTPTDRRSFLIKVLKGIGITAFGGIIWGAYINDTKAAPLILRPPGSAPENDFLALCIRCGQCVEACNNRSTKPRNADVTLKLAKPGDQKPIGTPYFIPRETPCYMCEDVPCVPPCPTGALKKERIIPKGSTKMDINLSRMGLAVLDKESCIAYWGIQCEACYRACPLIDKAIIQVHERNPRTGKHALLIPVVMSDQCTGCGLCEQACVTKKAAIFVLPREIAMGSVDTKYIKGWDRQDEKRLENVPTDDMKSRIEKSRKNPRDYLNREGFK